MEYPSPPTSIDGDCSVGEVDCTSDTSQVTDAEMSSRFVGAELSSALPWGLGQLLNTCHETLSTSALFILGMQVGSWAARVWLSRLLSWLFCYEKSGQRFEHQQSHTNK